MPTTEIIFRKLAGFKFWNSSQGNSSFFKDFDYSLQNSYFLEHCNYENYRKILKIIKNIFNQFWGNVPFCDPLETKGNIGSEWFNNRVMISVLSLFVFLWNIVFSYSIPEFPLLIVEIRICNYSVTLLQQVLTIST